MDLQEQNRSPEHEDESYPPEDTAPQLPTIKESFLVILLTAGFVLVLSMVFFLLSTVLDISKEFLLIEGLFIIPAIVYVRFRGYDFSRVFRFRRIEPGTLAVSLVTGGAAILAINFIENLLTSMPPPEWMEGWQAEMSRNLLEQLLFQNAYDFVVLTLAVVVFAAVAEEMLFRGLIQQSLERKYMPGTAILITSVLFTLLHPFSFLPIFLLSVLLGWITWRTGALLPAIVIHGLNNGISLYTLNLSETLQQAPASGIPVPWYVFVLAMILCVWGLRRLGRCAQQEV